MKGQFEGMLWRVQGVDPRKNLEFQWLKTKFQELRKFSESIIENIFRIYTEDFGDKQ